MRKSWGIRAVVAILAIGVVATPGAAFAKETPSAELQQEALWTKLGMTQAALGDKLQILRLDTEQAAAHGMDPAVAADVECFAQAAPVPTYSASNKAVQWGASIICNTPGTLLIWTSLYTVVGSGENAHNVGQDTKSVGPRVDAFMGNSWGEPCLASQGNAIWIASRTPTYDGIAFNPPTQWTVPKTLPCGPVPG
jgi:hypothetical protein